MTLKPQTKKTMFALLLSGFALVSGCSSEAGLGESCDVPGKTQDECKSGGICAKPADDAVVLQCVLICAKDEDCGAGRSCNGVEGSNLKGCRIKK